MLILTSEELKTLKACLENEDEPINCLDFTCCHRCDRCLLAHKILNYELDTGKEVNYEELLNEVNK